MSMFSGLGGGSTGLGNLYSNSGYGGYAGGGDGGSSSAVPSSAGANAQDLGGDASGGLNLGGLFNSAYGALNPAIATGRQSNSPYNIGGNLQVGQYMPGGSAYNDAYNNYLTTATQNYQNILQGYQQTMANQTGTQQGIQQGYGQLAQNVQNTIQGIGQSQQNAINAAFAQQSGQSTQNLINSGLGNSTVLSSVQAGNTLQQQQAQTALQNQIAQLSAGYQSQLGLAGLGYANTANVQNTAEANQQLNFMNSVTPKAPNMQNYPQGANSGVFSLLSNALGMGNNFNIGNLGSSLGGAFS